MSIKIKLAKQHEKMINDLSVRTELNEIQHFIDGQQIEYVPDTINFIFIRGNYNNMKKSMNVVGVYINKTSYSIYGMKFKLAMKFIKANAQIASMNFTFPESFMGELKKDEGILVHLEIPVKGLNKDSVFSQRDIFSGLYDIQLIKKSR